MQPTSSAGRIPFVFSTRELHGVSFGPVQALTSTSGLGTSSRAPPEAAVLGVDISGRVEVVTSGFSVTPRTSTTSRWSDPIPSAVTVPVRTRFAASNVVATPGRSASRCVRISAQDPQDHADQEEKYSEELQTRTKAYAVRNEPLVQPMEAAFPPVLLDHRRRRQDPVGERCRDPEDCRTQHQAETRYEQAPVVPLRLSEDA